MIYYLDASAWVKRYVKESGSDSVERLFESALACGSLGVVEIISTFARKHKAGYLTKESLQERIGVVEQDWEYFLQIPLPPDVLVQEKLLHRHTHCAAPTRFIWQVRCTCNQKFKPMSKHLCSSLLTKNSLLPHNPRGSKRSTPRKPQRLENKKPTTPQGANQ